MKPVADTQACHGYSHHHEAYLEKKGKGRVVAAHLAIKEKHGVAQGECAGILAWYPAMALRKTIFGHIYSPLFASSPRRQLNKLLGASTTD